MSQGEVCLPEMGESVHEATVTKWLKKEGDAVEKDEILLEVSTDKVDTEIPSPHAGILGKILVPEGAAARVGQVLAVLGAGEMVAQAAEEDVPEPAVLPLAESRRPLSSPLVRRIAAERGVDLRGVPGTGAQGRITKNDVLAFIDRAGSADPRPEEVPLVAAEPPRPEVLQPPARVPVALRQESVQPPKGVAFERVAMSTMRRKIAEHMVLSKQTSPHVTSVIEVNMQRIVDLREKNKEEFERRHGFRLSFTPFFMMAAVEALKAVPVVNSMVDGTDILYLKDINLGVAVALENGLIVPVVRSAGEKNFVGLARALNDLAERARTRRLSPDDVQGGTFSLTNFGVFGSLLGQPIINQPQVAIMGTGVMEKRPVVIDDAIAIRTMCYVVLSFDHRVIDGAEGGKFLAVVKSVLENWNQPVI